MSGATLFLIAGEPSGDALGRALMSALKEVSKDPIRFVGIGGEGMKAEGLESLFPMSDLSVMGLVEVLPRIPRLLARIGETVSAIEETKPDAVITIDAPDFCFRVAAKIKARGRMKSPLIHYVAPTVWAWRPGRARKIAPLFDHLMALFPFEPPYFERVGLKATFVGHPVVEGGMETGDGIGFRSAQAIAEDAPLLLVLPGSRRGEIRRLIPIFRETAARLAEKLPGVVSVIPTLEAISDLVEDETRGWPTPLRIVSGDEIKKDAFAASDAGLAASGTVALELAMAGVASVVGYRFNPLTAFIGNLLVKVDHMNLVNLVLGRRAVPEFRQDECLPEKMAETLLIILTKDELRHSQQADTREAMKKLGLGGERPSWRAARVVLDVIGNNKKDTKS